MRSTAGADFRHHFFVCALVDSISALVDLLLAPAQEFILRTTLLLLNFAVRPDDLLQGLEVRRRQVCGIRSIESQMQPFAAAAKVGPLLVQFLLMAIEPIDGDHQQSP